MLISPSSHGLRATLGRVSTQRVFVARLSGCSVFDPAGDRLGKVRDVVVIYRKDDPPRVVGLVVEIPGRRHVFVSIGRVTSIATGQVITTGLINVRRFQQRGGEVRVMAEMLGRRVLPRRRLGHRRHRGRRDRAQPARRVGCRSAVPAPPEARAPRRSRRARRRSRSGTDVREDQVPGEAQSAEQLVATFAELKPADLANTPARPARRAHDRGRRGALRRAARRRPRGDARGRAGAHPRAARRRARRRHPRRDGARRRRRPPRPAARGALRGAPRPHGARRGRRRPRPAASTAPTPPAAS